MAKSYCQHGCYPVDKHWHGGGLRVPEDRIPELTDASGPDDLSNRLGKKIYDGSGDFVIEDIVDLRRFVDVFGAAAAEKLLRENTPAGEPYVRGRKGSQDEPVMEQITKRAVSISGTGQGHDMAAYLDMVDRLGTHYDFDRNKVKDWVRATPQSQVHQEFVQRQQQAEQQINRTMGNIADLYEQKQLLEHDLRKLQARMDHFENATEDAEDTEDELKADFVDLVDQHTGRHSILQMQANNIFPSLTADFYSMTALSDLEDGHLKDLPENEKAVLRKKWKLYQKWKDQFRTAVKSKLQDVKTRLNSVETSIEQTEEWLKPYVQDIKQMEGDFEDELDMGHNLDQYLMMGTSSVYRAMKIIAWKDQSPTDRSDKYYDVLVMEPFHGALGGMENPQAAGQGLVVFSNTWIEYLCCRHVFEAVFEPQIESKKNEVKEYISRYLGEPAESVEDLRSELHSTFDLSDGEADRVAEAESVSELERIKRELWNDRKPGFVDRIANQVQGFLGFRDDFWHPDPSDLRRGLMGPHFPSRLYLDYKYENDLYVMK